MRNEANEATSKDLIQLFQKVVKGLIKKIKNMTNYLQVQNENESSGILGPAKILIICM